MKCIVIWNLSDKHTNSTVLRTFPLIFFFRFLVWRTSRVPVVNDIEHTFLMGNTATSSPCLTPRSTPWSTAGPSQTSLAFSIIFRLQFLQLHPTSMKSSLFFYWINELVWPCWSFSNSLQISIFIRGRYVPSDTYLEFADKKFWYIGKEKLLFFWLILLM